jgi:hypothetical protein
MSKYQERTVEEVVTDVDVSFRPNAYPAHGRWQEEPGDVYSLVSPHRPDPTAKRRRGGGPDEWDIIQRLIYRVPRGWESTGQLVDEGWRGPSLLIRTRRLTEPVRVANRAEWLVALCTAPLMGLASGIMEIPEGFKVVHAGASGLRSFPLADGTAIGYDGTPHGDGHAVDHLLEEGEVYVLYGPSAYSTLPRLLVLRREA